MRSIALILAVLALTAWDPGHVSAQDAGQALSLTGCLAQETDDDGETTFILADLVDAEISAETVVLIPGEDVNLNPHVGHTVEATGTVAEEEADEDAVDKLHLHVIALSHIAASCPSDA